jgi:hypothetical protein
VEAGEDVMALASRIAADWHKSVETPVEHQTV